MRRIHVIGAVAAAMLMAAPAVYAQGRYENRDGDSAPQRTERRGGDRSSDTRQGGRSRSESGSEHSYGTRDRSSGSVQRTPAPERSAPSTRSDGRSGSDRVRGDRGGSDRSSTRSSDRSGRDTSRNDRPSYRSGPESGSRDDGYRRGGSSTRSYPEADSSRSDRPRSNSGDYRSGSSSRSYPEADRTRNDRVRANSGEYRSGSDRYGSRTQRDDGFRRGGAGRSASSGRLERNSWSQYRAHSFVSEHRSWSQRGGYSGYRIPVSYFRGHFGRDHWFAANSLQFVFTDGYPCFDYGDYRFTCLDPYPEYWGDDWYYNDDCYVDYVDDGYYLCNRRYPGRPGIAISINLRF